MAFRLSDDGTLDTILACEECGEEARYNFMESSRSYEVFVAWALADAESEHECQSAQGGAHHVT